jgi:hypothetical protein
VAWKLACSHSTADPPAFYLQLFSTTGTALDVSYLLPGLKMTRGPVSILGTPSKYLVFGHQKFCRHKTLNATISLFSTPLERLPTISLPNAIVWRFVRPAVVVGKFEIPATLPLKVHLPFAQSLPSLAQPPSWLPHPRDTRTTSGRHPTRMVGIALRRTWSFSRRGHHPRQNYSSCWVTLTATVPLPTWGPTRTSMCSTHCADMQWARWAKPSQRMWVAPSRSAVSEQVRARRSSKWIRLSSQQ